MTPKQKAFVAEYLQSGNATAAYVKAYGVSTKSAEAAASRLLRNGKVSAEVARHQARAAERAELTAAAHIATLETLRDEARAANQYAAAITAETKRGEVAGLYVKRREDVTKLSPAERAERVRRVLRLA